MVHFNFFGNVLFFKKVMELLDEEGIVMHWKKSKMRIASLFDILFMFCLISLSRFCSFGYCSTVKRLRDKTQKMHLVFYKRTRIYAWGDE